jgi:predicted metal-binding membrane protein
LTTGYIAVWVGAGALLALVAAAMRSTTSPAVAVATAAGVAVGWQWSPAKQRCLNRTHAHPASRAFGCGADRDAWCAGITHACWCVGSCWAAMLATMLVEPGWQLAVMAVVSMWLWAERLDRPTPPAWSIRFPAKALRLARAQAHNLLTACSLT